MTCENCGSEHNGSYGSGRFCCEKCARGFSTRDNREEINRKVSETLGGKNYIPKEDFCLYCGNKLINKQRKFCNNICAGEYRYLIFINKWKLNLEIGTKNDGFTTSTYIRKYLWRKYKGKCSRCGWDKINPFFNKPVLEIEHIDGNCTNNKEDNLDLICPNCHSLTSTYKALNTGNGKKARLRYYKLI